MDFPLSENVLLLGMFYSQDTPKSSWSSQGPRDRIRCIALEEKLHMNVYTLDDKHSELAVAGKHCQGDFSSHRLFTSLCSTWQNKRFNSICLDYFFSPQGWAADRWTKQFFIGTLPELCKQNWLIPGGSVWLPNIRHVEEMLETYNEILSMYFRIEKKSNPHENPLFQGTELCKTDLQKCIDNVTNDNELPKLASGSPFYCLVRIYD